MLTMSPKQTTKYRPNMPARSKNARRQALALDRKLARETSEEERSRHEHLLGEINRAFRA
jgi:hypothetical protein